MRILQLLQARSLPVEGVPVGSDPFRTEWSIGLFLFMFALLAWVRVAYPMRFKRVLDCLRAPRFVRHFVRDEVPLSHPASWSLFLVSVLSGGLFLYQHDLHYGWQLPFPEGIAGFAYYASFLLTALLIKLLSLAFLRFLIGRDSGIMEYMFHLVLLIEAVGILLLPLTLVIAFVAPLHPEQGFFLAYCLAGTAFLLLLYRAIRIAQGNAVPPFYIFLYLCTLEILPLIVISKAFIDHY